MGHNLTSRRILAQNLRFGAHVPVEYAALRCSILHQTALELIGRDAQEMQL